MRYTATITDIDHNVLYHKQSDSENGIKGGARRKFNALIEEGEFAALAMIVTDEDGFVLVDERTDAWAAEVALAEVAAEVERDSETNQPTKRPWKVRRANGPARSFASPESAREFAAKLTGEGEDATVVYGELNPPRDCACGCGEQTKGGTYLPGHDRRHFVTAQAALEGDEAALIRLRRSEVPAETMKVIGTWDPEVTCDHACSFARGDKCTCSCAGSQHGSGWAQVRTLLGA